MRVALLSYRSQEHCGGQGVYVRHLSRALVDLGHDVEVLSGPPYPDFLDPRVRLTRVPSLDLYREPDPFRTPHLRELRTRYDVLEWLTMLTGCFAEPLAFSLRVGRMLRDRPPAQRPDVVHDNQTLGWGLPALRRAGVPLVATVHHPISRDLALELAAAPTRRRRVELRRWYAFVPMQAAVTRRRARRRRRQPGGRRRHRGRLPPAPGTVQVVPLGVDTDLFAPPSAPRTPGRLVAVASAADQPLKGVTHLLDALAKLRAERDVTLDLVGRLEPDGPVRRRIAELGLEDAVTVHAGISEEALAGLLAGAQLAVVASLYEGFSLPTVEAMACATPVVASDAGALPEVLGDAGVLVPPGDAEAIAAAVRALLDDDAERARLGAAARARAQERFGWASVARRTVAAYEEERALHARTVARQGSPSC